MKRIPKIPKYVLSVSGCKTRRQWKSLKRTELKNVLSTVNKLRMGSAFIPDPYEGAFNEMEQILMEYKNVMSVKEWGR